MLETLKLWLNSQLKSHHKLLVAYSGGKDSHVLLDALVTLKSTYGYVLEAIHINHGLQSISPQMKAHCAFICENYHIPLHLVDLSLQILPGESLEEKARLYRYRAMKNFVDENTLLLTAHTQGDQAETFLLQLIRGSGVKGLACIAPMKAFGNGYIARPLLSVSKASIHDYASLKKLNWIEDPSNQNLQLRRNFIRNEILKPLEKVHPNSSKCIARSAKHCQETMVILNEYVSQDVALCQGEKPHTLKLNALQMLSQQKQAWVLRHWLSEQKATLPSLQKCSQMLKQMLHAKTDAQPLICWGTWQLRRYQGHIYFLTQQSVDSTLQYEWDISSPITLADGRKWQLKATMGAGFAKSKLQENVIQVAYRQGGERCYLGDKHSSKSLKKVFQQLSIPPWERALVPLFYHHDSLIGVGRLFISPQWEVTSEHEEGFVFESL
ncbi:MAG: tRNA lysidine(34) synthetase TilS [Candidatus Berkiella sp.]